MKILICKDQAPEKRKITSIVYWDVCGVNKPGVQLEVWSW